MPPCPIFCPFAADRRMSWLPTLAVRAAQLQSHPDMRIPAAPQTPMTPQDKGVRTKEKTTRVGNWVVSQVSGALARVWRQR